MLLGGCLLLLRCLGGVTRGFICLSPHPLLPGWLTSAGPWDSTVLWDAAGNSQDLTLELQQRHKPWLCCCCSGCSITPGQVVTAFAAFSALSSLARALQLLQLAALPSQCRGLCCPGDAGHSCWEGVPCAVPLAGEPGEDRWVMLPCKAFPEVLAVLPSAWHWDAQLGAAQLPVPAHPRGSAPAKLPARLLFSRAGCAPRALPAQGLPRHLRPKIPVKSPCYLLSSVAFAADPILLFIFPLGVLHFDALTRHFPVPGPALLLLPPGLALGWNLLLSVPMSGFCRGLQPCCGTGLEGERALSFGLLCFLKQSSHRELAGVGRCPALVRLCGSVLVWD